MNFSRLGGEESDEPSSDNCSSSCTVFLAGLFFNGIAEGDSTGRYSIQTLLHHIPGVFFFLEDITVMRFRLKRTDLTTRFVLVLLCIVAPSCHRGSAGAPPAYNRGSTGSYRGITVNNLGSTGPYRHEPGLHRTAP